MSDITTINGKQFQVENIPGKGLCYVPVKTGMEQLEEYVKRVFTDGVANSSEQLNSMFSFKWISYKCKAINITLTPEGSQHIGLYLESQYPGKLENVFSVGTHSTWESFIAQLRKEQVKVEAL